MMTSCYLDSLAFTHYAAARHPRKLVFAARTREEAKTWQRKLHRKLKDLVGGFPEEACSLKPQVIARNDFPNYTRETVLFQSREALTVYAYFLKPKKAAGRLPVMICLPGHGRGCDDIVGIEEDGSMRTTWGGYQNDFALQAVHNGFAALAVEQLGFGHRRDAHGRASGGGASSCQPAAGAALLLGESMVGWRVYDVMRSIDYLKTREEINPKRIGCMGISGGGTITFFAAALDRRIKAAMVSGYFNSFHDSIMSIPHCIDNYVPGILNYAEMSDIAGLIAPRPLFIESGTEDPIFPVDTTNEAFDTAKGIYDIFGASDRIEKEIFEGEHSFHGVQGFPFLKKWL